MSLEAMLKQHKILLIEPPFRRLYKDTFSLIKYPLSLAYLASVVKRDTDWDVLVYNADFSPQMETERLGDMEAGFVNYTNNLKNLSGSVWQEIRNTLAQYKPSVVGITVMSPNLASATVVARLVKEFDERVVVVVGGPHPSSVGSEVLTCPHFDIAVKGEGERTIIELLDAVERGKGFGSVNGIFYRSDGQTVQTPAREFIEDLDSLPFPNESAPDVLKDYEKYPKRAFSRVFATRGCPFNCFFCGSRNIWSQKTRFRALENIMQEIKNLHDKFKIDCVHFDDDTFGVSKQNIAELCDAFAKDFTHLKWSCELHVNLVDEDLVSSMNQAGCCMIQVGIESGNNDILKKINKHITVEKALSACRIIKKHGIELQAFFMVGFPWDTEETLADTTKAMRQSKADILQYSIFTPYPGTEMFQFCRENNLIDDSYDVSLYNHQSPKNSFCRNISPERFRTLAAEMERFVDQNNSRYGIKHIFSESKLQRVKVLGIRKSFKKGVEMLRLAAGLSK